MMIGTTAQPGEAPRKRGRPPLDRARRTKRILDAATEAFTNKGYSEASLTDISQLAGVTKRTIYELVGDKEALFRSVCAEMCKVAGEFSFEHSVQDMSVREVLTAVAHSVVQHSLANETIAFNRTLASESLRFPDLVVSAMDAGRVVLNDAIAALFADLMDRGLIKRGSPPRVADMFYDLLVGNRPLRAILGYCEAPPDEDEIRNRIDIFLNGMTP